MKSICIMMLPVLLIVSCASKKNVNNKAAVQTQTEKIMNDTTAITINDTLPLIVQFYSIGTGINANSKTALDNYISEYEKLLKKSISYQVVHWGREGEYDACFRLANLDEEQRHTFISELKKLYDENSRVHILENQNCRYVR